MNIKIKSVVNFDNGQPKLRDKIFEYHIFKVVQLFGAKTEKRKCKESSLHVNWASLSCQEEENSHYKGG